VWGFADWPPIFLRARNPGPLTLGCYHEFLLRLQYIVLVDPPASKEAVAHHFLAKQKDEADQDGHQEKLYDSRPG
jgi:hypothetical protein